MLPLPSWALGDIAYYVLIGLRKECRHMKLWRREEYHMRRTMGGGVGIYDGRRVLLISMETEDSYLLQAPSTLAASTMGEGEEEEEEVCYGTTTMGAPGEEGGGGDNTN